MNKLHWHSMTVPFTAGIQIQKPKRKPTGFAVRNAAAMTSCPYPRLKQKKKISLPAKPVAAICLSARWDCCAA